MVFASLESGIIALIVGIALVLIARANIEPTINKILYIIGILFIVVAIIAFVLYFVGIVV